jgi:peptidoglycan/LPS O-acetylase OafA/YrhL
MPATDPPLAGERSDPGAAAGDRSAKRTAITIAAIGVAAVVLAFFAVDTLRNDPWTLVAIVVIAVLAVVLDTVWKRRAPGVGPGPESGPLPVAAPR